MSEVARIHLWIGGRVQGVAFRASARSEALRLGLKGWVRNLPDGGVETVAEGPPADVEQYRRWCSKGPPAARVTDVKATEEKPDGTLPDFEIVYY